MNRRFFVYSAIIFIVVVWPIIASASCSGHLKAGSFLSRQHKIRLALYEYRAAYASCGYTFESLAGLARALNDFGEELDSEQSIALYQQALNVTDIMLQRYPDRAESHFLRSVSLGNLALRAEQSHQAEIAIKIKKSLDRANHFDPNHIGVYIGMGILYRHIADLDRGSRILAFMLFNDLPHVDYKDAIEILKEGLEIDWCVPRLHYELALAYLRFGDAEHAKVHFNLCIALDNRDHQDNYIKKKALQYLARL
jgi:tetratricopeptide (TPR) repeat protein